MVMLLMCMQRAARFSSALHDNHTQCRCLHALPHLCLQCLSGVCSAGLHPLSTCPTLWLTMQHWCCPFRLYQPML